MPFLKILNGKNRDSVVRIEGRRFVIGRASDCNLSLNDSWTSREHVHIVDAGEQRWMLEDLQSENGTFLNARRVRKRRLHDGDTVRVGKTKMRFVLADDAASRRERAAEAGAAVTPARPTSHLPMADPDDTTRRDRRRTSVVDEGGHARIRELEKQLEEHEQRLASLANENAVLKKGLAKQGVTPPDAPGESGRLPRFMLRHVLNPKLDLSLPGAARRGPGSDAASTEAPWSFLGCGLDGDLLCASFFALGHRGAKVLIEGLVPETKLRMPASRIIQTDDDGVVDDLGAAFERARDHILPLLDGDDEPAGDLFLLGGIDAFGVDGEPIAHVSRLREALELGDPGRQARLHALLLARDGLDGIADWTALCETGKLSTVIVARAPGAAARDRAVARTVTGILDTLRRCTWIPPLSGSWPPAVLDDLLGEGGLAVVLGAETADATEAGLDGLFARAHEAGTAQIAPSIRFARTAGLVAVVGADLLDRDSGLAARLTERLEAAGARTPQARRHAAIVEASGDSVRLFGFVGGLGSESFAPRS